MATDQDIEQGLCDSCRELKPVYWTDSVGREYCAECFQILPVPSAFRMFEFLMATIPFGVGDRVECRTAGALYDGVGVIDQVSMDPKDYGTPVYPSFHVKIEDKAYEGAPDSLWYTENCLRRLTTNGEQSK